MDKFLDNLSISGLDSDALTPPLTSHFCLQYIIPTDTVTNVSTLSVSDDRADWDPDNTVAPVVEPHWDQGKPTTIDTQIQTSAILSQWGTAEDQTVFVEDETYSDNNDYWDDFFNDSDSLNETQATARATAINNSRKFGHVTHTLTIFLRANQAHLVGAGSLIQIKAAAAISGTYLGTFQNRRVATCYFEPLSPVAFTRIAGGTPQLGYKVSLDLDRPLRGVKSTYTNSKGSAQSQSGTPHSARELPVDGAAAGIPGSPTTAQDAFATLQTESVPAGGTTGQVLTKIDGTDYNTDWETPFANPMTTAADLIVGDTGGTPARLAKGSDGQVLTVDPSTHLLVWATPGSGSSPLTTKGDIHGYDTADARVAVGTDGYGLVADSTAALGLKWAAQRATLNFVIDGGGSAITTGVKGDVVVDFAGVIESATLLADQSGSIVIDIWKDVYASFPPTVADTITASAKPTLSSADHSQDTTLTGWTTAISAGDVLRFNVDSASTVTRVTLALKLRRT